jgi:hypothetical protein
MVGDVLPDPSPAGATLRVVARARFGSPAVRKDPSAQWLGEEPKDSGGLRLAAGVAVLFTAAKYVQGSRRARNRFQLAIELAERRAVDLLHVAGTRVRTDASLARSVR